MSYDWSLKSIEDSLYIKLLLKKISLIREGVSVQHIPIILDATASGQQVLPLVLQLNRISLFETLNLTDSEY